MKNPSPLVSVIVSTYNRGGLIGETIKSILAQSYPEFELIVVDDGSTDNTKEVVNSFHDSRIVYAYSENWGRPARPRNIGIEKAKGQYIAFCDDDDLWFPNKIEEQLKYFDDDIIGVGSSSIAIGDLHNKRHKIKKSDMLVDFNKAFTVNTVPLSSLIVKNLGYSFNESEDLKFVEDFDFQVNILHETKGKIYYLSIPLIYYRYHEQNNFSNFHNATNHLNVIDKYKNDLLKSVLKISYQRFYYDFGWAMLKSQNCDAKHFLFEAIRYSSFKNLLYSTYSCLLLALSLMPKFIQKALVDFYFQVRGTGSVRKE